MTDRDDALRALHCLDLTNLNDICTSADIDALIAKARSAFGDVAAICIWPRFVAQAKQALTHSNIRIATVINFPSGDETVEASCIATRQAMTDGANEIDVVLPWRAFLQGKHDVAHALLLAVAQETKPQAHLKVILETGELKDPQLIRQASELAIECGADFIKTSTGKTPVSATPEAARAMLQVIRVSGKEVGFKASGGIRSFEDAKLYLSLCDEIMGPEWAKPETFRFGASGLLDALLERLSA